MSSYIILELDTTAPEIEIYAPSYTTTEIQNEIYIVSNKDIFGEYQEVYIIDNNGNRHDYTFQKEDDRTYVGILTFALFPLGIATIYVRMMDDVGNLSDTVMRSFEIKESLTILVLDINDKQHEMQIDDIGNDFEINEKTKVTNISSKFANIEINDKSRKVELSENDRGE